MVVVTFLGTMGYLRYSDANDRKNGFLRSFERVCNAEELTSTEDCQCIAQTLDEELTVHSYLRLFGQTPFLDNESREQIIVDSFESCGVLTDGELEQFRSGDLN